MTFDEWYEANKEIFCTMTIQSMLKMAWIDGYEEGHEEGYHGKK